MAVWKQYVDLRNVFHDESKTFEERRDNIVSALRKSKWGKSFDEFDDLPLVIGELSETADVEEFNLVWDAVYDIADANRVWIKTR